MAAMPPWLLAVLAPVLGFAGAMLGTKMNQRGQRRTRLEDAYAELFGAVQLMLRVSFSYLGGPEPPERGAAWVRFGTARACVLFQEHDVGRRQAVKWLEAAIEDLCTTKVYMDGEPSDQQKYNDSQEFLGRMNVVKDHVDLLLALLRGRAREAHPRRAGGRGDDGAGATRRGRRETRAPRPRRRGARPSAGG
jgi:hypothetical protein